MKNNKLVYPLCLLLLCILFCLKADVDTDLFWHMTTGRWIVDNLSFPTNDVFSFVYNGADWVNITWLFQILAYGFHKAFGYLGVLILTCIFCGFSVVFSWASFNLLFANSELEKSEYKNTFIFLGFLIFAISMLFLEKRWIVRPEIFTAAGISASLYILIRSKLNPDNFRILFFLPLIQIFWVNSHSMFILGYILIGALWLQQPKKLLPVALLSGLAALINPYFLDGALYPFYLRAVSADPVYRIIRERQALIDSGVAFENKIYWSFWFLLSLASIKPGCRIFGWSYFLLYGFCIFFSISMVRNLSPAMLITLPFLCMGWLELFNQFPRKVHITQKRQLALTGFFTLVFAVTIASDGLSRINRNFNFGTRVQHHQDLEPAARFIIDNSLGKKGFTTPEIGNYLMWLDPNFKTYIDTRYAEVVPKEHFVQQLRLFLNPTEIIKELNKYGLSLVAINHTLTNYHKAIRFFSQSPAWDLVYWDHFISIFLPAGIRPELAISTESVISELTSQVADYVNDPTAKSTDGVALYHRLLAGVNYGLEMQVIDLLPQALVKPVPYLERLNCSMQTYNLAKIGIANLSKSDLSMVIEACQNAVAAGGKHSMHYNLSVALRLANRLEEALEILEELTVELPENATYQAGLAQILTQIDSKKHQARIEKAYEKSLKHNPFQLKFWQQYIGYLLFMKEQQKAQNIYQQALKFHQAGDLGFQRARQ